MIFWISGTGMVQPIPKFWGQEWENTFTTFGDENGIENYIPNFGNGNHDVAKDIMRIKTELCVMCKSENVSGFR